jgi:peptide/nickel transport system substrate-binding protein
MFSHSMGTLFPFDGGSAVGPLYGRWYASRGAAGKEPPPRIREVMAAYTKAFSVPAAEHIAFGQQVWRIAIDEQWTIGTVGLSPAVMGVRVAKGNMGNIPARQFNGSTTLSPAQSRPETFFFKTSR